MNINDIKVENRFRKNVGDLSSLKSSIQDVGLLHPIVIKPNGTLIAGLRRLRACQELGWNEIPVNIVNSFIDATKYLIAERDENVARKSFLPSEAFEIAKILEPMEKEEAKTRQGTRTDLQHSRQFGGNKSRDKLGGNFPQSKTRDKLGEAVGMSGRSLEKAQEIIEAAEKEPIRYQMLVEKMDQTGNIDRSFKLLRQEQRKDELQKRYICF